MQLHAVLLLVVFARGAFSSPLPLTDHVESLQPRGLMSDLSYEAWDLGSRFMRGTGRWLELNTAKLRGFEVPLPGNILPAGLSGVGDDMAALLKQVASEDPDISAEAIRSINVMRTDAYSAASHFGGELLDKGQVFTGQDAKILYAYAAAGDWESYQALRYVEKQDPNVLKDFGVDLTPLKVKWKKPTAVTVGAAAAVGIAATSVWALSQVLESSPPDGIPLEAQQTIDQILRDNPDDKDALLKVIDDTPNITPEQRAYFRKVADEAKKPTGMVGDGRS